MIEMFPSSTLSDSFKKNGTVALKFTNVLPINVPAPSLFQNYFDHNVVQFEHNSEQYHF